MDKGGVTVPELPEAENIARALKKSLSGQQIADVEVFTPAMRTSLLPLRTAGLAGKNIVGVRRRGRYVVIDLDDGRGIMMHFGMSGVVRVESAQVPRRRHEHLFLHLTDGRALRFECTRRFSLCEVCDLSAPGGWPAALAGLGVEPLEDEFNPEYLFQRAKNRRVCVKTLLMDNEVVVGIGNIYVAETLFAAGVSPLRESSSLTREECGKICAAAKEILTRAIAAGGTTISDFLNVDGSEGKFVRELLIYGRAGQPCARCRSLIVGCRIGGRSSFYCPQCQH